VAPLPLPKLAQILLQSKLSVVGSQTPFGFTSVRILSSFTLFSLGVLPTNLSIRLVFPFFLSCYFHRYAQFPLFLITFSSLFIFNSFIAFIVCVLRENLFLNSNGGLRPPSELLSGYFSSFSPKSIGRVYRTCYLHESNRRWVFSHETTPFWPGPDIFRRAKHSLGGSDTSLSQTLARYFCAGIRGVSQTLSFLHPCAKVC
jgi:hypothetical protein